MSLVTRLYVGFVCAALACATGAAHAAQCDFQLTSEWNEGFVAVVSISNDDAQTIDGWVVTLDFSDGAAITQLWNGALTGTNPYDVANLDYNAVISPGAITTFGFLGQKNVSGEAVLPPDLGGVCGGLAGNQPPLANLAVSVNAGDIPLEVTFDGSGSTDPNGDSLTYLWGFSDGFMATDAVLTRVFNEPGTYTAILTVSDGALTSSPVQTTVTARAPSSQAAFALDTARSSLFFVSSKNVNTIESHTFNQMTGDISGNVATVRLVLDSVESGIDLRNERMRELLFETDTFSEATISLPIDPDELAALNVGTSVIQSVEPTLQLHGISASVAMDLRVTRVSTTTLLVQNTSPIVVRAADFDLVDGIEALRNIANLAVISYSVPTNFTLVFNALGEPGAAQ